MSGALFFSSFVNKIDKKGRVSLPSKYREIIAKNESEIILNKSLMKDCLEICTLEHLERLSNLTSELNPLSMEKSNFDAVLFGESTQLDIDANGRIMIPKIYLKYAGMPDEGDNIVFLGKGNIIEIWEETKYHNYIQECREFAKKNIDIFNKKS